MSNPYQTPLPDEFLDDTVQGYEESLRTHEQVINGLRDRIAVLEAENERLKWQLVSSPVATSHFSEEITRELQKKSGGSYLSWSSCSGADAG